MPLFAVITLCLIGFFFWTSHRPFDPKFRGYLTPNEYGDSFGMTNAVFSALAFLGVIFTLILQMIELKAQRDEMKLQRKEMEEMQRVQLLQLRLDYLKREDEIQPSAYLKAKITRIQEYIERHSDQYLAENDIIDTDGVMRNLFDHLYTIYIQLQKFRDEQRHLPSTCNELDALTRRVEYFCENYRHVSCLEEDHRKFFDNLCKIMGRIRQFVLVHVKQSQPASISAEVLDTFDDLLTKVYEGKAKESDKLIDLIPLDIVV